MGYAQAGLLGDYIVNAVSETEDYVGASFYDYLRGVMAGALWAPPEIEDELDGMVASLAETHPSAAIDDLDLKVVNTFGDWGYACRSHMCWGRYVAPPIKTGQPGGLDFGSPVSTASHHVLCARSPDDGSPRWVNLAWPGSVTVATGAYEFGTLASLHDYKSAGAVLSAGRMPRMVAARHALTFASDADLSTHLTGVFAELRLYGIMTNGFLNYYAPEGHGGVMTADRSQAGPDFYHLRLPQVAWHHGEAIITTNSWTDGATTPADENFGADAYYDDESPKTLESLEPSRVGGARSAERRVPRSRRHDAVGRWEAGVAERRASSGSGETSSARPATMGWTTTATEEATSIRDLQAPAISGIFQPAREIPVQERLLEHRAPSARTAATTTATARGLRRRPLPLRRRRPGRARSTVSGKAVSRL
jgi:hypothetical protein